MHLRAELTKSREAPMLALRGLQWREGVVRQHELARNVHQLAGARQVTVAWRANIASDALCGDHGADRAQQIYEWLCRCILNDNNRRVTSCGVFDDTERHDPVYYHLQLSPICADTAFFLVSGNRIAEAIVASDS
jgi:hypothetical protein